MRMNHTKCAELSPWKMTMYGTDFSALSLIPERWENGVQEVVSSTLATRTKQGPSRSAEKEPWNESFTVLFLCCVIKQASMELTLNAFFARVLNTYWITQNSSVLKGLFLHQWYMVFTFSPLILFRQNRKFYGTAIVLSCTMLLRMLYNADRILISLDSNWLRRCWTWRFNDERGAILEQLRQAGERNQKQGKAPQKEQEQKMEL